MAYPVQLFKNRKLKAWSRWIPPVVTKPRDADSSSIAALKRLNS